MNKANLSKFRFISVDRRSFFRFVFTRARLFIGLLYCGVNFVFDTGDAFFEFHDAPPDRTHYRRKAISKKEKRNDGKDQHLGTRESKTKQTKHVICLSCNINDFAKSQCKSPCQAPTAKSRFLNLIYRWRILRRKDVKESANFDRGQIR